MKNKTRKTTTRNHKRKNKILKQSPLTERITSTPSFKEWKNQKQPRIDDSDEIVPPHRRALVNLKKESHSKGSIASNDMHRETERMRKRERLRDKTKRKYVKIRADDSPPREPPVFKKKKMSDSIHLDKETVTYGSGLDGTQSTRKSKKKKLKNSKSFNFSRPTKMRLRSQIKPVKSEPAISGAEKVFKDEMKRVYEQRLIKIYERKNVRKLKTIKDLMMKNQQDLHGLYLRVCHKYRIAPEPRFDLMPDDSGDGATTSRTEGGPSHSSNDTPAAGGDFDLDDESPIRATRQSRFAPKEFPPPKSSKSRSPLEVFNRKQELLAQAVKMSRSRTPMKKSCSPDVMRRFPPPVLSRTNAPSRSNSPEFSNARPRGVQRENNYLTKRRSTKPRRKSSTSVQEQMKIIQRKRSSFTDDMNDTGVICSNQEEDSDPIMSLISEKQFMRGSRGPMKWNASKKRSDPATDVDAMYASSNVGGAIGAMMWSTSRIRLVGGAIMPVSTSVRSLPGSNPDSPMNENPFRVRSQPPTIGKNGEAFLDSVDVMDRLDTNTMIASKNFVTPLSHQRFSPVKNKMVRNHASARLLQACKKNSISHLTSALKHVSNPEASSTTSDKEGLTPLHWAVFYKNATLVKLLVQAHCAGTANTKNNAGQTPLHWVCRNSDFLSLKCLFFVGNIDVNLPDADGFTPLMWACRSNSPYCVQALLEREEIDVNFSNIEGHSALHWVCKHNNTRCLVPLLRHPTIDMNEQDSTGCTPLHWACLNDAAESVQILLRSKPCDINAKNKNNYTSLHYACQSNSVECLRRLLTHPGIDLSVRTDFGNTPCHLLCRDNSVEGFRMLADLGHVDVNVQNKVGLSPLHFICQYNSMDILQALLNRQLLFSSADFFLRDENGKTPIDVAEEHGHLTLLGFLTE